jgi:hypothetical protein
MAPSCFVDGSYRKPWSWQGILGWPHRGRRRMWRSAQPRPSISQTFDLIARAVRGDGDEIDFAIRTVGRQMRDFDRHPDEMSPSCHFHGTENAVGST